MAINGKWSAQSNQLKYKPFLIYDALNFDPDFALKRILPSCSGSASIQWGHKNIELHFDQHLVPSTYAEIFLPDIEWDLLFSWNSESAIDTSYIFSLSLSGLYIDNVMGLGIIVLSDLCLFSHKHLCLCFSPPEAIDH